MQTILMTRPRVVVVELCVGRLNILRLNEETILEEAKNLNFGKNIQHSLTFFKISSWNFFSLV